MPKLVLRPLDEIAKKWVEETPKRATYYEAGVKAPKKDWATEAATAASVYKAAVSNPNIDKLFKSGVTKAGTAKWQRKAINVGVARFGPGVSAALEDYKSGWGPFYDELTKLEIPERGPRGEDKNYERVIKIGKALNKKRLALAAVS
jgi:hypothetical protein